VLEKYWSLFRREAEQRVTWQNELAWLQRQDLMAWEVEDS